MDILLISVPIISRSLRLFGRIPEDFQLRDL